MEKIGQLFRLGLWTVRPENASEFIVAWRTSGEWLIRNLPAERGAVLLQDIDDSSKFTSFAPISDSEKVRELMMTPEFQDLWSPVMELCEDVKPNGMRVVSAIFGEVENY